MARAKRISILIIKVNKLFSFFSLPCFLKETGNMYSVFLSSYSNTRESLGELEKAVETLVPTAFLVLPKFHSIETRYMYILFLNYLFLLAGQATAMAQSPMKMFSSMLCLLCLPLVTFCATAGKKSSPGSSQDKVSSLYL